MYGKNSSRSSMRKSFQARLSLEPHLTRPRAWKTTTDFRSYIHTYKVYHYICVYQSILYTIMAQLVMLYTLYITGYRSNENL